MTARPGDRSPGAALAIVDDASLAIALADLASALDIPATPDIATAVRTRLGSEGTPARRPRVFGRWPSLRVPRAILVVSLVLVALLVVAGVAAAIGLGLPGLQFIFSGATPPPASAPAAPSSSAAPTASLNGSELPSQAPSSQVALDFGTPTTLAAARASVTFKVFAPDGTSLGGTEPAVFLDDRVLGGAVVLAYSPGGNPPSGVLVTESRGSVDQALLGKVLGTGTTVERIEVNGQAGYWISGRPHSLLILDASGQPVEVTLREIGDVLVWVQGGTLLRIESPLGLAQTLRIAQSMR